MNRCSFLILLGFALLAAGCACSLLPAAGVRVSDGDELARPLRLWLDAPGKVGPAVAILGIASILLGIGALSGEEGDASRSEP